MDYSLAAQVLILQSAAESGYPGFDAWREQLQKAGVLDKQIHGVPRNASVQLNTLTESEALIEFARQQQYNSIFIVAPPFQQLRAFMTAVTVALRVYPQLLIYSYPAAAEPWLEEVAHSQGTLTGRRSELIHAELERIDTYQQKGDLAMTEPVLEYLNRREAIS